MKLPLWVWIFAVIVCWPSMLLAESYSATGPDGKITLTKEPCKAHEWLKGWQVARWMWKGKAYAACWRMQGHAQERLVVVLDSSGEVATFYPSQFIKDEGV